MLSKCVVYSIDTYIPKNIAIKSSLDKEISEYQFQFVFFFHLKW